MHCVLVCLGRAAGHVAAKTSANMRDRWYSSVLGGPHLATVFPATRSHRITLVDVVVLSHARRLERKRGQSKISYLQCALRRLIFLNFDLTLVAVIICALDSLSCTQSTTSDLLCRRAVATDSNFGLEERKRRGLEI
jgi:hypothetical protein